ncbi:unnamed protein product [Darwinula stevensoni]|uniref:Uncharacterized protein n=1 Tax=Darwinula stevensoni TaxID=69355 RepID=A0A7R8XAN6_9CRUS|nr:unnamed protein product [Darwinula stevensoni]CAG0890459.1 unnamed protein product [Darwinula stevensoni]
MLRLILCLATVLPAILAQGGSMDSFEEFVTVLRAGYHTAVNYDSDFCESSTFPVPIVLSVHFDRWQYIEGELQVPSVLGVQTFMTREDIRSLFLHLSIAEQGRFFFSAEGANVIVYSIVSSDGHATAESFVVSGETELEESEETVSKRTKCCSTTLATYDELLTALMESRRLFIAASLTDCGHPLPPEVYLAEGGSTYYHFYVVPGEAGEDVLVVEYPGLALSEIGEGTVFTMHRLIVSQDGSVSIRINYFNTLTWEDEYPFPEGFQCVLGESARFRYDSG